MKIPLLLLVLLGAAFGMSKLSPAALMDVQQEYCVIDSVQFVSTDSASATPRWCYAYLYRFTIPIDLGADGKRWLTLEIPLTSPTGHDTVRIGKE